MIDALYKSPGWRPRSGFRGHYGIRGLAAQSVLVTFQFVAANLRKTGEFLAHREAEGKKVR